MTDCAVLFPGQGAYLPGALAPLAEDEPLVRETLGTLDAAAVRLGRTAPSRLLLDERAPSLADLVATAPADLHTALFAAELTLFRLLTERHGLRPGVLLGHSFGELVALTAAGAYGPEEGLALVAARDDAFAARPPEPGGMVALGISAARTAGLLNGLGEWEVTLAADNGPRQCVVSGPAEPLERVRAAAEALGLGATRLRVPYAFHHRSLAAIADDFAHRAAVLRTGPVRHVLHSAILGRRLEDADAVADLVAAHLVRPTRFTDTVRELHADGVDVFVECGPRGVLSDLVAATVPGVRVVAPLRRRAGGREVADALDGVAGGAARTAGTFGVPGAAGTAGGTGTGDSAPDGPGPDGSGPDGSAPDGSAPDAASAGPGGLDPEEVVATLRALYADALGYPPEVLTRDADLEADLGVDSIKQTELFARAVTRYGRALPAEGSRLTSYTTLDALAGLLSTLPAAGTAGAAGATA
ncbi:acyltransferase domain-containing protein [Streptomyces filamentosus]|uniref:acyltransferase domain-containing protein n=1 Tax=Streptomyces filamentosus TaxID=67294 RepID=UPI0036E948AB